MPLRQSRTQLSLTNDPKYSCLWYNVIAWPFNFVLCGKGRIAISKEDAGKSELVNCQSACTCSCWHAGHLRWHMPRTCRSLTCPNYKSDIIWHISARHEAQLWWNDRKWLCVMMFLGPGLGHICVINDIIIKIVKTGACHCDASLLVTSPTLFWLGNYPNKGACDEAKPVSAFSTQITIDKYILHVAGCYLSSGSPILNMPRRIFFNQGLDTDF